MPTRQESIRDELARAPPARSRIRTYHPDAPGERAVPRGLWVLAACEISTMTVITLYSKPDCHLCVEARATLMGMQAELGLDICEVDITTNEQLHRAYFERIPVVALGEEELFEYFVDEDALRDRLKVIL
jgi:glutaredoxin